MRYHIKASFQEEQRKGFVVMHTIDKETDTHTELNNILNNFTYSYCHEYCHHLDLHITENES